MDTMTVEPAAAQMAIDGIFWSWRSVGADDVDRLSPFVMAADPGGGEAAYWQREARSWLGHAGGTAHGITSIENLAGITLGLFFYSLVTAAGCRDLFVERLRWLELARPHRSLDAVLAIVTAHGQARLCQRILLLDAAASERNARTALRQRAETAGFAPVSQGWARHL